MMNFYPILAGFIAIIFSILLLFEIRKKDSGTLKMQEISKLIYEGALTYLNKQYKILIIFAVITALVLSYLNLLMAVAFLFGALLSALAGNIGMRTATIANSKTAEACKKGIPQGLNIAFSSGAVMGLFVVGLGLLGVSTLFIFFQDVNIFFGFAFGASSIALFARVGGGVYTKAADIAADIVGKIEKGIPEDDPRNPAVIADQVGDNVGDVAGMGADLFESYISSIIAAITIGSFVSFLNASILPLLIAGLGIFISIIGILYVKFSKSNSPSDSMNKGVLISAVLTFICSYFLIMEISKEISLWYSVILGLISGVIIGFIIEYYTSNEKKPTQNLAESSKTGAATNIITGLSLGMESTFFPVIIICITILGSYYFAGLYGISLAAVGLLSTLGITLSIDTFGPVADNAAGIAQMAKQGPKVRKNAEALDSVGNTTAAVGKGFAISSAALTSLALFSTYSLKIGLDFINIINPNVIVGIFIGALLPFIFTSITLKSVGNAANEMIIEIRKQFKAKRTDYNKCIEISTSAALNQMILPTLIAILSPIIIFFVLGPEALGGLLAGSIATGFMLALFMANAGGAWDNAKKHIEKTQKGSFEHKAAVVGDTVGDPIKDCSAPSLNILIKLMSIIAVLIAILTNTI